VLNKGVALLQKPFTPSALALKLRAALDGHSETSFQSGVAIEFRGCILNCQALSRAVQNMRRQGFGSGRSDIGLGSRGLRPLCTFISLLVAGFSTIFFPGSTRAQSGTVMFAQSTYTANLSQSNASITVVF